VKPTYRLALLTALAFLLVAPLPLQLHLGHPERSLEMYLTPHTQSAMAMFRLRLSLVPHGRPGAEIWARLPPRHRPEVAREHGIFQAALRGDGALVGQHQRVRAETRRPAGPCLTVIGIPSAFLLHGYVGFIFGSIKANPWWSTPLMPIVFLFSAIVSGIACILLLYFVTCWLRRVPVDMPCVDTIAKYLY